MRLPTHYIIKVVVFVVSIKKSPTKIIPGDKNHLTSDDNITTIDTVTTRKRRGKYANPDTIK